jgi:hypothetical protein
VLCEKPSEICYPLILYVFSKLKDFLCEVNHLQSDMKIIDLHNPERVNRKPDQMEVLFSSGDFQEQGFLVKHVEMRLYVEKIDEKLGPFSLITSFVQTDKGTVEMLYDEGFRGDDSLNRAVKFLISNLGISALILRSIIVLKSHTSD